MVMGMGMGMGMGMVLLMRSSMRRKHIHRFMCRDIIVWKSMAFVLPQAVKYSDTMHS